MSATSRMLGRWMTGGCGCCSGQESDPRRFKLAERRAVREEIAEELAERAESPSTTVASAPRSHHHGNP